MQYLDDNKYCQNHKIITASGYGVPQNRKRLVLIASKNKKQITYPEKLKYIKTVRDTINHLPPTKAGYKNKEIPLHQSRGLSEKICFVCEILQKTVEERLAKRTCTRLS